MVEKPTRPPIRNEARNRLRNSRGAVAVARTEDPHSGTSQFFINLVDNPNLDGAPGRWGYAVFGKVTDGMDVVDKIAAVETGNRGGHQDVPVDAVTITEVTIDD